MNKKEFLEELDEHLIGISKDDREEILQDYEEHFKIGKGKKRSESEIIRSLGLPKEIAREIRRELSSSEKSELKSEFIETWVATKKFSKHLFNEARDGLDNVFNSGKKRNRNHKASTWILIALIFGAVILIFSSLFFMVLAIVSAGYLLYRHFKKKSSKVSNEKILGAKTDSAKKNKNASKNNVRVIISVVFNVLFFIWFWISFFFIIIALFISGLIALISGTAVIVFAAFSLIGYNTDTIHGILLSGLYTGMGIIIFGVLLFWLSRWFTRIFFLLTKKYIKLNTEFIRK